MSSEEPQNVPSRKHGARRNVRTSNQQHAGRRGAAVMRMWRVAVCAAPVSQLIDTAQEANDVLDRWFRNQHNIDTITCKESDMQEAGVKQERDMAENEDNEMIQNKGTTADDEGIIPMEEIKYKVTSDDDNDYNMSDNIESYNLQMLSNSECINIYVA